MKLFIVITILCSVHLSLAQSEGEGEYEEGQAEASEMDQTNSSLMGSMNDVIKGALNKLPDGETKNGLKEYLGTLGIESYGNDNVSMENKGLMAYYENRFADAKNSCVRNAALAFYKDVEKSLSAQSKGMKCNQSSESSKYGCSDSRAQLSEVAGEGRFKGLSPGWLWQLALKHSKNDPNSAIFLIGMCGHDDRSQGYLEYADESEKALDALRLQRQGTLAEKAKLDAQIKELSKNYDRNQEQIFQLGKKSVALKASADKLQNSSSLKQELHCPPITSGYYAPQSLGKSADISQDLKNTIAADQKTADGAKSAPAKYYHVYGSALMACQLVQNGFSPTKASFVQQQAARVYRGVRMCESVNQDFKQSWSDLSKKYKAKDIVDLTQKTVATIKSGKVKCPRSLAGQAVPPECDLLYSIGYSSEMVTSGELVVSASDIKEKIGGAARNSDALELYKSWYLGGGTAFGRKVPCTDVRMFGPNNLMKPDSNFFDKLSKPKGWSDERYRQASQKLGTWDDDFQWTIAQHKAGADFAGKNCKKRAPGEKPLRGICPNGPPDGVTNTDLYQKDAVSPADSEEGVQ
ncbi:hypothetical protein ACLVWU_17495 [Bdellovibrio sp. HCB290]|uniref:hypothetical protein n=1 Tax=Bdellovibrio sp. HCB290 TaxID=3394356 RepID=UPI0039B5DA8F